MKKIMTRAAETALATGVAGGMLLLGPSVAGAQEAPTTAEGDGFVAGNAVNADVDVPVILCGLAASALGVASGTCDGPPAPSLSQDATMARASGDGVGTGNAVGLDIDAPVTLCGVGVVGALVGTGVCDGAAAAADGGDTTVAKAEGNGFLAGNALGLDVDVPITVCGLGGALLGAGTGTCTITPPLAAGPGDAAVAEAAGNGFLAGNALGLNVDLPINICGVGIAVGGIATGDCATPAAPPMATSSADNTSAIASGNGLLTGNAIAGDMDVPIIVCGGGGAGIGVATGVCDTSSPPDAGSSSLAPGERLVAASSPVSSAVAPRERFVVASSPVSSAVAPTELLAASSPASSTVEQGEQVTTSTATPAVAHEETSPSSSHHATGDQPQPIAHSASTRARISELPRTGSATDLVLPVGVTLVAAGMALVAAARRRLARIARRSER